MDAHDPIEHVVAALPPFMQRRMAKLSLAGVRFISLNTKGAYSWKVAVFGEHYAHFVTLELAVNETWREWMLAMPARDANTEDALEGWFIHGPPDG